MMFNAIAFDWTWRVELGFNCLIVGTRGLRRSLGGNHFE